MKLFNDLSNILTTIAFYYIIQYNILFNKTIKYKNCFYQLSIENLLTFIIK
jgi:hypothetical protein